MLKLCAKDFLAGRWWWLLALIVYGLNLTMNTAHDLFVMVATAVLVIACLILTLVQDYVSKTEALYGSLPLTRATIVGGRYLLMAFLSAGGYLVALACAFFLKSMLPLQPMTLDPRPWVSVDGLTGYVLAMAAFAALYLPLYYRFGLGKSTVAFTLVILAMVVSVLTFKPLAALKSVLSRGFEPPGRAGDAASRIVGAIAGIRQALGTPAFLAAAIILVVLILTISIRLSVRVYEKSEF